MNSEVFKKFYSQLNSEQKEAVDTLEGPLMVVAGPGTGKTQVLTLRIANILLQEKAKPEEILALTFTESGVAAMRKRLIEILGPKAYYIPIHTFHAFCNEIIQDNPDEFPQFHDKNVVDEIARMQIMESVMRESDLKLLKPFGDNFMYVVPLLRTFSDMKREGIGPQNLKEFVLEEAKQFEAAEDLYHEKGPHKGKMKGQYKDWERNIEKNKEMALVYAIYQEELLKSGYDYDDIILSVVERLAKDAVLLQKLQEQYKYLLADEHQDTNQAQNKVLELLCARRKNSALPSDGPNIFVVGDENQSIYRFQGANLANFLYFHSTFPDAKIITLKENYRSSQKILDASGSVIGNNFQRHPGTLPDTPTRLFAKSAHAGKKVRIYSFQNSDSENYFFSKKIGKLMDGGVRAQEIVVLYRDNKDAFPIRDMLEKSGIACAVESDEQILENSDIKNLFLILGAAVNFGADEALAKALHADFLKIPPLDIYRLLNPSGSDPAGLRGQTPRVHGLLHSKSRLRALGISRAVRLNNFYKKLSSWNKLAHNKSAPQALEAVVRESGFFDHVLSGADYIEGIARLRLLHRLAKRLASESASGGKDYSLGDFVRHLELIQDRGVFMRERKPAAKKSAVRMMTAHRAKGLEFDYVFIARANMGHWGKRRTRQMLKPPRLATLGGGRGKTQNFTRNNAETSALFRGLPEGQIAPRFSASLEDDERRLFYVALTRARKRVYISYPLAREDGRELFPSQFVEEIADEHKTTGNSEIYDRGVEQNPKIFFTKPKEVRAKEDEREFLRETFEKRGLSPTALNNYLECPWKYFYNNLLQIPRAKTKHEMYGTAVHAALKDLFDNIVNPAGSACPVPDSPAGEEWFGDPDILRGQIPSDYLLARFERALLREPISARDFEESLAKGKEALAKYFDNYNGKWHTNTVNEFAVKNVLLDGEVRLTGKIDKIELLAGSVPANKRGQTPLIIKVNVVDYKTGKRRTRNELEGKTKNAKGNEKRQLVFYKLLIDKLAANPQGSDPLGGGQTPKHYVMTSGEIDFVEPEKQTGKFYREKFEITDEDVRELEYKIQDVVAEILGFAFWNERCEAGRRMVPGGAGYRLVPCEYCNLRETMR